MSKTRHYRPEERSIHRVKPVAEKATKYKQDIFKVNDDEDDEFDDLDEDQDSDN